MRRWSACFFPRCASLLQLEALVAIVVLVHLTPVDIDDHKQTCCTAGRVNVFMRMC